MRLHSANHGPTTRGGFTLAEVAVTIVIVGIALSFVLQSLQGAQFQAAHTRNYKLARDLALEVLGQVASGQLRDDLDGDRYENTFPDHPGFRYTILLGEDEEFDEVDDRDRPYDSFAAAREREVERSKDENEGDEEVREPYQRVQVRVSFAKLRELRNYVILEDRVPWDQVYGPEEEDQ